MTRIAAAFLILYLLLMPTIISGQNAGGFMDNPLMGNIAKKMFSKFSTFLGPVSSVLNPNPEAEPATSDSNDIENDGEWDYYEEAAELNRNETSIENKIRQCSCQQSNECITKAHRTSLSSCRSSCKSHLEYFGTQTAEFTACIPKDSEVDLINSCLRAKAPQYCAINEANSQWISKPNYSQQASKDSGGGLSIEKLAGFSVLEHIKSFHFCTDTCLKKKIIACFESNACAISLPPEANLANIPDFCVPIQVARKSAFMKTFSCFTIQRLFSQFF